MSEQEKIAMLEEMMELEEGDLSMETRLEDLEEWDSLSKLSLMALLKKKAGKTLTVEEIRDLETVGDICSYFD